jgi:hypothetical protein
VKNFQLDDAWIMKIRQLPLMSDAWTVGVLARILLQSPKTESHNHLHMKKSPRNCQNNGELLKNLMKK